MACPPTPSAPPPGNPLPGTTPPGAPAPPLEPPPFRTRLTVTGNHSLAADYSLLVNTRSKALAFSPAGSTDLLLISLSGGRVDVLHVAAEEWAAALDRWERGVGSVASSATGGQVAVVHADGLSVCGRRLASGLLVEELGRINLVMPPPRLVRGVARAGSASAAVA